MGFLNGFIVLRLLCCPIRSHYSEAVSEDVTANDVKRDSEQPDKNALKGFSFFCCHRSHLPHKNEPLSEIKLPSIVHLSGGKKQCFLVLLLANVSHVLAWCAPKCTSVPACVHESALNLSLSVSRCVCVCCDPSSPLSPIPPLRVCVIYGALIVRSGLHIPRLGQPTDTVSL